jgi:hypothetical protein
MHKHVAILAGFLMVAVCIGQASADINLITNGGFETGDFTGWTPAENSFPMYTVTTPAFVHSGSYAAQIAGYSYDPDTLSQVVADTPGQSYELSFWRYISNGNPTVSLNVTWNGTSVFSELNPGASQYNQYQQFSATVVGTGSDTLEFICANDPSETYLDDVSLTSTTVPEPTTLIVWSVLGGLGLAVARWRKRKAA